MRQHGHGFPACCIGAQCRNALDHAIGLAQRIHQRNAWVQGTVLKYSSGYTQGSIGFGFDVAAFVFLCTVMPLLRADAARNPLVLVLEDVQRSQEPTLLLLR